MRRFALSLAVLAVVAAAPQMIHAQGMSFHVGAGIANGIGDLSEDTEMGWLGFAGITIPIMSIPGLGVGATASYAHIPYEGDFDEATNIPALVADVSYLIGATSPGRVKPYVRAGVGVMQHRYDPGTLTGDDESETKLGVSGGAGILFRGAGMSPFVGVHVASAGSDTGYYTAYVGLSIGGSRNAPNPFRRR